MRGTSNPLAVSLRDCPRLPMNPHADRRHLRHQTRRRRPYLLPWISHVLLRRRRHCHLRRCWRWRAEAPAAGVGRPRGEPRRTRARCWQPLRRVHVRLHAAPGARRPSHWASPAPAGRSGARTRGGWPPPRAAAPWPPRVGGAACGARPARLPAEPWRPTPPSWPPQQRGRAGGMAPRRRRRQRAAQRPRGRRSGRGGGLPKGNRASGLTPAEVTGMAAPR